MSHFLSQSQVARFMIIAMGCIAIIAAMHTIASILNPIFIAILFAVLFDIPRSWLMKRGMSPNMALLVTILATLLITLVFMVIMAKSFLEISANLPAMQQQLQAQLGELGATLSQYGIQTGQLQSVAQNDQTNPMKVISYVLGAVVSLLGGALLILVYAIFLLIEVSSFPKKLAAAFNPTEPAYRYTSTVTTNLRSFLVAQTQVSLVTGTAVTLSLWILGVQFPLLWGVVAFFMNFIPYIGSILAAIPAVIVAFIQYGPSATVLWVIVAYLLVNVIVNYTIYPRLMSKGVDVSMFVVLAGMVFWGWVLGPIGLILSVPMTAVIKISLESYPGSRWLAIMLGPGPKIEPITEAGKPAA